MNKRLLSITLTLCAMVFTLASCDKQDKDFESLTANKLMNTKWSYERLVPSSHSKYVKHWGSLAFASAREVFVTSGSEERYEKENSVETNRRQHRQEVTQTATYTYQKPVLRITMPAKGHQPAYVVVLKVDEEKGLMTQVSVGSDDVTDDPVVYKRQ